MRKVNGIPPIVMLVAGAIACLVSAWKEYSVMDSMICILISILVFYLIGLIAKAIISNVIKKMEEKEAARLEEQRLAEQLEQERLEQEALAQERKGRIEEE